VSFDTIEENRAFAEKFDFNFPLLCDTGRKLGMAYGAARSETEPSARRAGVVIGPDGKIREYAAKVDASSYPTDVLARL